MMFLLPFVACSIALLQGAAAGSRAPRAALPRYFETNPITRRELSPDTVSSELGPLLSPNTVIFGPSDPAYANATTRWITFVKPDIEVVVQPAAESDISKIIQYCNDNSIDFLARSRGHGGTLSLNVFKGLEIDLQQLQGLEIQEDGKTVRLQGGAYAGPVIRALWDEGYVTATGSAYCVGLGGLGLGGGHGRLEGLYGLVLDGFVNLNVVLADASEISVNETSHDDLFWAMRGAGHNFGIVTSLEVKIYPKPATTFHFHSYIWTQDKLETVFEELNNLHEADDGTTPPLMSFEQGLIIMNTSISDTEAVLSWSFVYNGPAEDAEKLLQPFNAIGAAYEEVDDVPFPEIAVLAGTDENGPTCSSGPFEFTSTLLVKYNVTTQRELYNHFMQKVSQYPDLGATARLAHEGYFNAAVHAVPSDSTAYPHRDQNLIVFFLTVVPPGSDLLDAAETWAKESWDLWNQGKDPLVYVNYAIGHPYETLESVYGYEPWRLDRLRGLKAKYDPTNSFRFYVPIIPESS